MKLKQLETEIKVILETLEKTRSDDMYLYQIYCTKHDCGNADRFQLIFLDKNFRKENAISGFESVSRCRRKLQAKYPWLQNDEAKRKREEQIEKFKEYSILN